MSTTGRVISYLLMSVLLALMVTLILEGAFGLRLFLGWLLGINAVTFVFYGIDRLNSQTPAAKGENLCIPEANLLLMALLGGSPMAMVAIVLFNHKSSSSWFIVRFLCILAVQGALIIYLRDQIPLL